MRYIIILILISNQLYSQSKKDTSILEISVNQFQIDQLNDAQKKLLDAQKESDRTIELIIGIRKEDIEKLEFKEGKFYLTKKKKNG